MSIVIDIIAMIGALVIVLLFGAVALGAYALATYGDSRDDLEGVEIDGGQVHDVDPVA